MLGSRQHQLQAKERLDEGAAAEGETLTSPFSKLLRHPRALTRSCG